MHGYLADFGLAKLITTSTSSVGSKSGQSGTPGFQSPELLKAERVDVLADVYSFAWVCFDWIVWREASAVWAYSLSNHVQSWCRTLNPWTWSPSRKDPVNLCIVHRTAWPPCNCNAGAEGTAAVCWCVSSPGLLHIQLTFVFFQLLIFFLLLQFSVILSHLINFISYLLWIWLPCISHWQDEVSTLMVNVQSLRHFLKHQLILHRKSLLPSQYGECEIHAPPLQVPLTPKILRALESQKKRWIVRHTLCLRGPQDRCDRQHLSQDTKQIKVAYNCPLSLYHKGCTWKLVYTVQVGIGNTDFVYSASEWNLAHACWWNLSFSPKVLSRSSNLLS